MPTDQTLEFKQLGKEKPESAGVSQPPTPAGMEPGNYTAEGDPYTYRVEEDGSITITSGPTGKGAKLTSGAAFDAIRGQIGSGRLKFTPYPAAEKRIAADSEARKKPSMREQIEMAADEALGPEGRSDAIVDRAPSKDLPPNISSVR